VKRKQSSLERKFAYLWRALEGPPLEAEYRFAAHLVGAGRGCEIG
jgi:hypothetical protein